MLNRVVQKIPESFSNDYAEANAYRKTAEIYEALGDHTHAVECFEYALSKNPKIGVKRRIDVLKKVLGI
jgi:Tfp pilus assembly protein PilF